MQRASVSFPIEVHGGALKFEVNIVWIGSQSAVQVVFGVGCRHLTADPRLALRDHGETESRDEHPFVQQLVA